MYEVLIINHLTCPKTRTYYILRLWSNTKVLLKGQTWMLPEVPTLTIDY